LGVDQAIHLARPGHESKDVFAPITQVAVDQLDESMRAMYRFGDKMQTSMVDMAFSWMDPNAMANLNKLNPFRSTAKCCGDSDETAEPSEPSKESNNQE